MSADQIPQPIALVHVRLAASCGLREQYRATRLDSFRGDSMWGTLRPKALPCLYSALMCLCVVSTSFSQSKDNLPLPEYYGTYAVAGQKLLSVDSSSTPKVSTSPVRIGARASAYQACQGAAVVAGVSPVSVVELPSDVHFIVFFQPSGELSPMVVAQHLELQPVDYVRSVQVTDCVQGSPLRQGTENAWDFLAGPVEMRFKPIPGQQEMVVAAPASDLAPGVYMLSGGALKRNFLFAIPPLADAEKSSCIDLSIRYSLYDLTHGGAISETPIPCAGGGEPSGTPTTTEPATMYGVASSRAAPSACSDEDSCVRSGNHALGSSAWDQALADFQNAAKSRPTSGLPWFGVGNTYLAMKHYQDAAAAWDKALSLHFPLPFSACRERGIQQCELGELSVGPKSVSFRARGQTVLDAPLSQITVIGTNNHRYQGYISFGLVVEGKTYNFDFIPFGITVSLLAHIQCPPNGMEQQIKIGDYLSQTIPKLASGALVSEPVAAQAGATRPVPSPAKSPSSSPCGQAVDSGYSILLQGHLYKVKTTSAADPNQAHLFFDEKGDQVIDSNLLQQLATAAWTRENVVVSPDARNGGSRVSAILGTSKALEGYTIVQDAIARGMVEAVEAVATDGASLTKAVPNATAGILTNQLKSSPKTLFVIAAQHGLEMSLNAYKQIEAVPLPPADATVLNAPDLIRIKNLYIRARTLELPYGALAAELMPTNPTQLTNQAFASAISQIIPAVGFSSTDVVTLKTLLDFQKSVANLSESLPALQAYSQNLKLGLDLADANKHTISEWATKSASACGAAPQANVSQAGSMKKFQNEVHP